MTPAALLITLIIVGVAVLVLVIWRRSVSEAEPPPATPPEETGVWGVGGPAMREPGSTGIVHTLRPPRADRDDD